MQTRNSSTKVLLCTLLLLVGCGKKNHSSEEIPTPDPSPTTPYSSKKESPRDKKQKDKLASADPKVTASLFNDDDTTANDPVLLKAIDRVPDDFDVWPHLESEKAKLKFIQVVLDKSEVTKRTYISEQQDGTDPFVCRHFTRLFYYNNRNDHYDPSTIDVKGWRYKIDRAPVKLRLPIYEMFVEYGPSHLPKIMSQYAGLGYSRINHMINAVHLGGDSLDPKSWVFVEPQQGLILFRPDTLDYEAGDTFSIGKSHTDPLNKECSGKTFCYGPERAPAFTFDERHISFELNYSAMPKRGVPTWQKYFKETLAKDRIIENIAAYSLSFVATNRYLADQVAAFLQKESFTFASEEFFQNFMKNLKNPAALQPAADAVAKWVESPGLLPFALRTMIEDRLLRPMTVTNPNADPAKNENANNEEALLQVYEGTIPFFFSEGLVRTKLENTIEQIRTVAKAVSGLKKKRILKVSVDRYLAKDMVPGLCAAHETFATEQELRAYYFSLFEKNTDYSCVWNWLEWDARTKLPRFISLDRWREGNFPEKNENATPTQKCYFVCASDL